MKSHRYGALAPACLLPVLLACAAPALAGDLAAPELTAGTTGSVIQQGQGNRAALEQGGLTLAAQLRQEGSANQAQVQQAGQGNTLTLNQQGDGNLAAVSQSGSSNTADVDQRGTGNVANLTQSGIGVTALIQQYGNNNRADVAAAVDVAVRQYGDGMTVSVVRY